MTGVARISDSAALRRPRAEPGSRFCAIVHRRIEHGFVREVYTGAQAVIALTEIGAELPLAEFYERVELAPEPDGD